MINDRANVIDVARAVCLCRDGLPGFWAATAVAADGGEHLLLVERDSLGDSVTYDPGCCTAPHEQLGALPLEYVRKLTVAARRQTPPPRKETP